MQRHGSKEQIPPLNPTSPFFLPSNWQWPQDLWPQGICLSFSWSSPEPPSLSNGGGISGALSSAESMASFAGRAGEQAWYCLDLGKGYRYEFWVGESHLMPDY